MGGPNTRSLQRGIAFSVVVGLHGLAVTLMVALRNPAPLSPSTDFVSSVTLLSALPPPAGPSSQPHNNTASDTPALAIITPPLPLPAELGPPADLQAGTDWTVEAQQAAAAATFTPDIRVFGTSPAAESARAGAGPLRDHLPGEQYRTTDGAWVVWVSDRCYLISEVPPVGLPDVLARSIPTRTVCQGDAGPRGDLFKDLPAYEKYQPR